jgi:hypothetical protein
METGSCFQTFSRRTFPLQSDGGPYIDQVRLAVGSSEAILAKTRLLRAILNRSQLKVNERFGLKSPTEPASKLSVNISQPIGPNACSAWRGSSRWNINDCQLDDRP